MNTLTKVFVVLLVIFSITFTMMTVQFSASVPDWRDQAEKWMHLAQMADTYNRNLIAAKVAEATRAAADRKAWDEQRADLIRNEQTIEDEISKTHERLAKAEADANSKDGTVKKLTAELSIAQASAAKAREHRGQLEERNIYLEKANLDLTEANNERIATIVVLEQQTRQQDQAINLLKTERDSLLKKMRLGFAGLEDTTVTVPTDKVRAATVARISPIRGQIQEVSGNHASISVGSDDGVEVGMVFIIYDEQGYLGDLVVTDSEPNISAGKLQRLNGQIEVGDIVVDENGYLAMN